MASANNSTLGSKITSLLITLGLCGALFWWLWFYLNGWPMPPEHVRNPVPMTVVHDLPAGERFMTLGYLAASTGPAESFASLIVYDEYVDTDSNDDVSTHVHPPIILEIEGERKRFSDVNYRIDYPVFHEETDRSSLMIPRWIKGFRAGDLVLLEGEIAEDGSVDVERIMVGPVQTYLDASFWDRWWTAGLVWLARLILTLPCLLIAWEAVSRIIPRRQLIKPHTLARANTPEEDALLDEREETPRHRWMSGFRRDPKDGSVDRGSER